MACLTIERVFITFCPLKAFKLKDMKQFFIGLIITIVTVSICIYIPMAWNGTELYWNPETGNFDLNGTYATWSLTFAMLAAFTIIFPANVALLIKLKKGEHFRSAYR